MSDPRTDYRDAPQGVITELISAMSALNMEPEPLPADQIKHDTGYLSDTDKWVRHAMEHLYAAYGMAQSCSRVFYAVDVLMRMSGVHPETTIGDDGSELIPMSFSVDEMVEFLREKTNREREKLAGLDGNSPRYSLELLQWNLAETVQCGSAMSTILSPTSATGS